MEKNQLRRKHLDYRDQMARSERESLSKRIVKQLLSTSEMKMADYILVYMDYRSEVITTELVQLLLKEKLNGSAQHRVFCPRVEGLDIAFYEIERLDQLVSGYQGIREPLPDKLKLYNEKLAENGKTIVITPGAVFDKHGGRIGYGKGFYDRFLMKYPKAIAIGIAFSNQLTEYIPMTDQDQRVAAVITEECMIHIK